MEDESRPEIYNIPKKWTKEFPALPPALEGVLMRLIEADQRLERLGLQLRNLERQLETIPATDWTPEQHKELQSFYRYRVLADREFHRNWKLLKKHSKGESATEPKPAEKPRSEPEVKIPRVYEEPTLFQTVVVRIVDGKTITAMFPANEEEMRVAKTASDGKRAIRHFEFPDGVPEEYHWVFPEPENRRPGVERQVEISAARWRELVTKEQLNGTGHAEPCPLEATRMDVIRMRLRDEDKL